MKKIILLFMFCIVITGCKVKSEIDVEPNGTVKESVTILENNTYFKDINIAKDDFINNMITKYKKIIGIKKYKYDKVNKSGESGAKIYKTYKNICEYFGNSYFNQYVYKYFKCEEDEYYFVITNATEYIPYCSDCSDWPKLDNVTLEINLPVAAAEHNADSVKDTKYIWEYGKDALSGKNFYLKISKLSLSESHEKYLKKQEQIKIIKKTVGIMALIIFFAVIIFVCIKLKNKYKENQLEY